MDLSTRDLYLTYTRECTRCGFNPRPAKGFRSKKAIQDEIARMHGTAPELPLDLPEVATMREDAEKVPPLTASERAKLRRLERDQEIEHVWGTPWNASEGRAALREHAYRKSVQQKSSRQGSHGR